MILHQLDSASTEKCWIKLQNHDCDREISEILAAYPGNIPVVLHYSNTKETFQSSRYFVAKDPELQEKVGLLCSENAFSIKSMFRN